MGRLPPHVWMGQGSPRALPSELHRVCGGSAALQGCLAFLNYLAGTSLKKPFTAVGTHDSPVMARDSETLTAASPATASPGCKALCSPPPLLLLPQVSPDSSVSQMPLSKPFSTGWVFWASYLRCHLLRTLWFGNSIGRGKEEQPKGKAVFGSIQERGN